MSNYINLKLKVKAWNYLATHQTKLAIHKSVATPWLRTTGLWDRIQSKALPE